MAIGITALAFETILKQIGSLLVADGVSLYSIKVCNARLQIVQPTNQNE